MLRGMPFVDLAYLKSRIWWGMCLLIVVENRAASNCDASAGNYETNKKYMNTDSASPYLFPILTGGESTEATYREYQIAFA